MSDGWDRLRDEIDLFDNRRSYFEDTPWGMEISDDPNSDFQRWARSGEIAAKDTAGPGGGVEAQPAEAIFVEDWKEFEVWIDGKRQEVTDQEAAAELEKGGIDLER